jgi:hypothetical protein
MLVGSKMISLPKSTLSLGCASRAKMRHSHPMMRKRKIPATNKIGEQTDES